MNHLNVLISNSTENIFNHSLKQISQNLNNFEYNNIIIVPDKLSLYAEQSIFNALNIEVYFNLSVMGITKFASLILEKNNLKAEQYTALESKLLVLRAIQNVCKDFKCFSKNFTLGFVDEIFAKIEQIKSSRCKIEDLIDENASFGTKLKFEDIKLIYNEYEKLRGTKLDGCAMLELFNKTCTSCEYLKNCNIYFLGFDSLTKQGLQILENASKFANYATISVVAPRNQNNFRLYDETFLDSIINMAKQAKIECETKWYNLPYTNKVRDYTLNNLFSRKQKYDLQNNYYSILKANSLEEESELCIKQINYLLKTQNLTFNDFAICCNENYQSHIISQLNSLGIDTYCDKKYNLFQLEPIAYIYNIFLYATKNNDQLLYNIISNDFCELSAIEKNELLTELKKYGSLNNLYKYGEINSNTTKLYLQNLQEINKKLPYLDIVKKIIENTNIFEKINQKCEIFEKNNDILLNKLYIQVEDKLNATIETLENLLNNSINNLTDFINIFQKILTETEIASVPSTTNQVFIGDTKSFFFSKKYLFILGMNEGILPIVLNDYGLISDKEILSETIKAQLEPTTKIINKRTKFKLFEIILSATKHCYLSYHCYDNESKTALKNDFLSELEFLFDIKETSSDLIKNIFPNEKKSEEKICFNSQNCYYANLLLGENQDAKTASIIKFALTKNNKLFSKPKQNNIQIDFSKLFFKNNKASISLIEKYNSCPKCAFLANGLRLQEIKKDKVEASIIGTFIHKLGELFVTKNKEVLGNLSDTDIQISAKNITQEILKNEEYYSLLLPENKFLLNLILDEANRFCTFLNTEQSVSEFKPCYTEQYFGGDYKFKPIVLDIENKEYYISGFVDRIDICDNYFRIIDYKTGNKTNKGGMSDLYIGVEIQLFVYSKAIKDNLNKQLFGAFYLPIKNSFTKNGKSLYSFSGFFEDNPQMVIMSDKNAFNEGKSEIIGAKFKKPDKNGEISLYSSKNIFNEENFDAILKYAVEIVRQSIKDINSGFISCSPINGKCSKCEFSKICKYSNDETIEREKITQILKEKYLEINYD